MKPYYTCFFRRGDKVYIREVIEDGSRNHFSVKYEPSLYFPSDEPNCQYKTLDGDTLKHVKFSSIKSAREYVNSYDKPIFGFNRHEYACINELYPESIQYSMDDLRVVYLDIETCTKGHYSTIQNPDQRIDLIQLMYKGIIYIFGYDVYESYDENVKFIKCKNEEDLLRKFVSLFRKIDPDIISDWNGSGYDLPMLWARMNHINMEDVFKRLSPFNMIDVYDTEVFGKPQVRVDLKGIQHLDLMNLIRKFDLRRFVNYKLDTVARKILGRGKVKYKGSLYDLSVTDYNKYVEYGLEDVRLLSDIENHTKYIELVVMLGYKSKTNYEDSFYQVRMWDCTFYDYLKNIKNIQVPYLKYDFKEVIKDDEDEGYEGAYVKPPVPGKYNWIVSDDVQSLYPSIMMAWNMSPETYRGVDKDVDVNFLLNGDSSKVLNNIKSYNLTLAGNGSMYTRDFHGFIPEVIQSEFNARVSAKNIATDAKKQIEKIEKCLSTNNYILDGEVLSKKELEEQLRRYENIKSVNGILDKALKVRINSAYGFLGNKHTRFYKKEIAEGITMTGQYLLKVIDKTSNNLLNNLLKNKNKKDYVVAQDTDSNYLILNDIFEKFVPKNTPKKDVVEFMDRFHKKNIAPVLKEATDRLQDELNVYEHKLRFVRDVICDVGIFLAKKRYVLQVWDTEGVRYNEPDMKPMGLELVKSSTPEYCQSKMKEAIEIILNKDNDDLIDYMENIKKEYKTLKPDVIASPRGISHLDKWVSDKKIDDVFGVGSGYDKIEHEVGTPYHVKGAIVYNNLINKYNLTNKYQPFTNGDKIKFIYLKNPNPTKNNGISFDDDIPEEFKLDSYIDYDTQYEKTLLSPIREIATVIGWDMEREEGALF